MNIVLDAPVEVRERNPDDVFSILLDPSKTNRQFDWKVTTALGDGVGRAIDYYREFGVSETYTHLKLAAD
jgi:UDP-glucose 4-epimerase